jgi:hypothetical protein
MSRNLLDRLRGGDRRSIGNSNNVVAQVLADPRQFKQLLRGLWSPDPVLAMRSADAAEKITAANPGLLAPHKAELLGLLRETTQQEIRWHLCLMLPRLTLTTAERRRAAASLRTYLNDPSSIVRTFTLQALADLSVHDGALREEVVELLQQAARSGTAAMKARARKLLKQLSA